MRQRVEYGEWIEFRELYPRMAQLVLDWAISKHYMTEGGTVYMPTIGEMIHFLTEWGRHYHQDVKIEQWVNSALICDDFAIGWDGEDLAGILFWQIREVLKKLL